MRRILIVLFILVLSLCGYFLYQEKNKKNEVNKEVFDQVMSEKMEKLYVQARSWQKPLNLPVEDARLEGDYKILSEFVLTYWMKNIEARNHYLRQLDQAKWREFLNAERLEKDRKKAYQQSNQMLIDVRQATADFEKTQASIYAAALVQIDELDMNRELRESMKEKLIFSRENNDEMALLQIERQIIEKAEQMLTMLKTYKWKRQDKIFLFEKEEQVRQCNVLYAEILEFQAQIDQLKKQNASVFETDK